MCRRRPEFQTDRNGILVRLQADLWSWQMNIYQVHPFGLRCSVLVDVGRWTLSRGHALIIPKCAFPALQIHHTWTNLISELLVHGEKLADIPDEYLNDTLTIAKKIAIAQGVEDYNILQNNGPLAHQVSLDCLVMVFLFWATSFIVAPSPATLGSETCPLPCYSQTVYRRRARHSVEFSNPFKGRLANGFWRDYRPSLDSPNGVSNPNLILVYHLNPKNGKTLFCGNCLA